MITASKPQVRRRFAALVTLALVTTSLGVGCSSADKTTSSGASVAATTPSSESAGLQPITFHAEPAAAASAVVTSEAGGTVRATGPDGTVFILDVPAGAVTADTELTIVPLTDVAGGAGSDRKVAARFEPDGQAFAQPVKFTLIPATAIPRNRQLLFVADHNGQSPRPALIDVSSSNATVFLSHFSMDGEMGVNDSQFDTIFGVSQGDLAADYSAKIAEVLQRGWRDEATLESATTQLVTLYEGFDKDVVQPAIADLKAGPNRCSTVKSLSALILQSDRGRSLLGIKDGNDGLVDALRLSFQDCEREAIRACKRERSPAPLMTFWLASSQVMATLGMTTDNDVDAVMERAKAICIPKRYQASGGGNGATISGLIPDLTRPFALDGTGDGFTIRLQYLPADDGRSGTMNYTGGGGGVSMDGQGTYTVSGDEAGPLTLTQTDDGCVDAMGQRACASGSETLTLTPVP